jgi:hypothetical protein
MQNSWESAPEVVGRERIRAISLHVPLVHLGGIRARNDADLDAGDIIAPLSDLGCIARA